MKPATLSPRGHRRLIVWQERGFGGPAPSRGLPAPQVERTRVFPQKLLLTGHLRPLFA